MTPEENATVRRLRAVMPEVVEEVGSFRNEVTVYIQRSEIARVCRLLRDDPELTYNFLSDLTALDWWGKRDPRFEVVYHLYSFHHKRRIRLKVRVAEGESLATTTAVWPAANWLEREVYDLFGIVFEGHPDLRRILMPEDWQGHPLRKDYPVAESPKWWEEEK